MPMVSTVNTGDSAASAPTRRMSRKRFHSRRSRSRRNARFALPLASRRNCSSVLTSATTSTDTAAPRMPSEGTPNPPSTSTPESGTWIAAPTSISVAGYCMSPMPRNTAFSSDDSHTSTQPVNSRLP